MNIISVEKLSKWQAGKEIFNEVSFGIEDNQKIALIGINGTGKSTLLRILSNEEFYDSGNISYKKDLNISFLKQNPDFDMNKSILDNLFNSDNAKVKLIKKYEKISFDLSKNHDDQDLQNELRDIMSEMDHIDAWQFENQVKSILTELGITDLSLKMSDLSGGMLKKVALAQTLTDESDIILMDEPTNHLDVKTIEWLQYYLSKINKALILVTHDRYLVNSVCNIIFEIDRGNLYKFDGNYEYYLEKKAEIVNSKLQEENRINSILRKELEWLKKGPKARSTKQKARIQRAHEMIDRDKYELDENIEFSISGRRVGKKILEVHNISKKYGDNTVIKSFSYKFRKNERIGIVGDNGSGKTTFLNILTGKEETDTGFVDKGINTYFGFFDQHSKALKEDWKAIDFIKEAGLFVELKDGTKITASQMMEKFLFNGNLQHTRIGSLSGGERRRLYLLYLLMENPNFLVLDEPTNDFDIKTLSILEDFLNDFDGCILVVSHDRYFMDKVADFLFIFDGNGNINGFNGSFSEYLEFEKQNKDETVSEKKTNIKEEVKKEEVKKKLTFSERQELKDIEKLIDKLEKEKKQLDELFSSGDNSFDNISKWNKRYREIEDELLAKMERWEYLASFEY